MNGEKKKFDIWPLVVGIIAAIGIIGSNSSGGITKQTSERTTVQTTTVTMPSGVTRDIRLISLTSPVKAGSEANIRISGQPNTEYSIEIRYGSTISTVSGLDSKASGLDGIVSWDWHIGSLTTRGEYVILIKGGGETLEALLLVN